MKFISLFYSFIFLSFGFSCSFYLIIFSNTIQTSFFSVLPSPPPPSPKLSPPLQPPPTPPSITHSPPPPPPPQPLLSLITSTAPISSNDNVNETSNKVMSITSVTSTERIPMMHNMSDEELFHRALVVSSMTQESSFKEKNMVPKVAFMFLTRGPIPLSPLWELFFKGHQGLYSIYVHPHPSYNDTTPHDSVFFGTRITSQPVYWGDVSMIDAERRLLANALLDPSNQRFVLLSESCIPLFNFTTTYNYLINSNLSYISSFDDKGKSGRGRYNPRMFPNITIQDWRKGSQWFEIHRELALRIVSDHKYYGLFREFCHPTCYCDEHYIPTMVHSLYGSMNSNRSVTYVDWSSRRAHPRKFVGDEINEEFLNSIRFGSSGCDYNGKLAPMCVLFARKFAPNTLQPLLRFAPLLFGKSP